MGVIPKLAVSAPAPTFEGDSGSTNFSFTVTLDTASVQIVTVNYTSINGTANSANDYTAIVGTVTFNPGVTSQTVVVAVTGDTSVEPDETFQMALSNPTDATIATASATATILNDDVAVGTSVVSLTSSLNPGQLGQAVTFTAKVVPATATGTIQLKEGATVLASGTVSGGQVSFTLNSLSAGEHELIAVYSGDSANTGATSRLLIQVVQTKKVKVKELLPANLVAKLRVSPDRFFSVSKEGEVLAFTLSIKNVGPGKAGMVYVVFPIAEGLEAAYTQFSRADIWVEKVVPVPMLAGEGAGAEHAYVQIHYPTLESGMDTEVKLYLRVKAGASIAEGTSFLTRYRVNWNDEAKPINKRVSNGVRVSFTARGESLNLTGGEVQTFSAPEGTKLTSGGKLVLGGDFYLPEELVTFWYTDKANQSTELGKARADAKGNISLELEAGKLMAGEEYVVAGYGNTSGIYGSAVIQLPANLATNSLSLEQAGTASSSQPAYTYNLKPFSLANWQGYFSQTRPK